MSKSIIFFPCLLAAIILLCVRYSPVIAQTLPQDFDCSQFSQILMDAGYLWKANSTFHPLGGGAILNSPVPADNAFHWYYKYLEDFSSKQNSLRKEAAEKVGLMFLPAFSLTFEEGAVRNYDHPSFQLYLYTELYFKENWYARFYSRFTDEPSSLPHYTGIAHQISRAGLRTGEIDQSIVGYKNNWLNIELGRSREIWGPFAEDNLLLSGDSPAWERLMFQVNYKNCAYRWFFGWLETVVVDSQNLNRYLVGGTVEYNNCKNFVFSAGQLSVLAGIDRPLDWAYLNPLSLHIEAESNERDNDGLQNHANWILFFNTDWLAKKNLRLTTAWVVDEFQIDLSDREQYSDVLGTIARIAWTPFQYNELGATFIASYIRNGTYLMQHEYGYTNLVSRGEVIGNPLGNDADDILLGGRLIWNKIGGMMEVRAGQRRWGGNSLLSDPYRPYEYQYILPFPSPEVNTNKYLEFLLQSIFLHDFHLSIEGHIDLAKSGEASQLESYRFSLRYQIPLTFCF